MSIYRYKNESSDTNVSKEDEPSVEDVTNQKQNEINKSIVPGAGEEEVERFQFPDTGITSQ